MIKEFTSTVLDKKMLTPSVVRLKFSLPKGLSFKPGQYFSVIRIAEGKKLKTPYSIASVPGKNFAEFCVKIINVGRTSSYLASLKREDKIGLFGPLGNFIIEESSKKKDIIFISTGTGVTPFVSMIPHLLKKGFKKKIILIKGFRNEEEILYDEESKKLENKYKNFRFYNVLSQPKNKNLKMRGYVQDFLGKYIPKNFGGDFYVCGLKEMVNAVKEKLISLGFPEKDIFYEKYD
ncbi:MAG: FAD-dependent oxidoreductase [archaeon]